MLSDINIVLCYVLSQYRITWTKVGDGGEYNSGTIVVYTKGVGPGMTLAWPGWKQSDIAVEVDTG
jgi:hypothetical protein